MEKKEQGEDDEDFGEMNNRKKRGENPCDNGQRREKMEVEGRSEGGEGEGGGKGIWCGWEEQYPGLGF